MEKKIMKPKAVIAEVGLISWPAVFGLGFVFLLCLACGEFDITLLILLLGSSILCLAFGYMMYHKDHIEIDYGKVIIDQKVMEWDTGWKTKGSWIHQRIEINPADVSKIGYSYELYGKYMYYHSFNTYYTNRMPRTISNMCGEVIVEMNDGRKVTFDPFIYNLKQLREIINVLSRNGEVPISPALKKYLRRRFNEPKNTVTNYKWIR